MCGASPRTPAWKHSSLADSTQAEWLLTVTGFWNALHEPISNVTLAPPFPPDCPAGTVCRQRIAALAGVACMRKLLTNLNAMVKHQTPWQPWEVAIA